MSKVAEEFLDQIEDKIENGIIEAQNHLGIVESHILSIRKWAVIYEWELEAGILALHTTCNLELIIDNEECDNKTISVTEFTDYFDSDDISQSIIQQIEWELAQGEVER